MKTIQRGAPYVNMMLTLVEFIAWTGLTVFEIWMHLLGLFITTILLAVKSYEIISMSYWSVFSPLFVASALDAYFLFIVFVRSIIEYKDCKGPILRFCFNWVRLVLMAVFEVLLCYKIEGDLEHAQVAVRSSYGVVFMPVWLLLAALCFQTCRLF